MKNLFILFAFLIPSAVVGQFKFGAGLNYIERTNQIGVHAKTAIGVNDKIMLNGSATYYLSNATNFDVNVDVNWRILDVNDVVFIYPLGGLNFLKQNNKDIDIGINLGLFSYFPLSSRLDMYLEPKIIVGSINSFVISAGVFF